MKKLTLLLAVLSLLAGACSRSYPSLEAAIRNGDRSAVIAMLAQPDAALQDVSLSHREQPVNVVVHGLEVAIVEGELQIARVLLEHVADVNVALPRGTGDKAWTTHFLSIAVYPAHHLRFDSDEAAEQYVETVRLLLDAGAKVRGSLAHACRLAGMRHEEPEWNARSQRALLEIIKLMCPHADLDARESGRSALRNAVGGGNLELAKILIGHGADVNEVPTAKEKPLLELARSKGHDEMATLLLQHGATDR
jgi:hypothetical protein